MSNDTQNNASDLMTVQEAAAYLNISANTLNYWRKPEVQKGPPYTVSGKVLRYSRRGADAWVDAHTTTPAVA